MAKEIAAMDIHAENAREIELKFMLTAETAQKLAEHFPWPTGAESTHILHSTYFDTPDQALRRSGFSLRIRKEGEALIQTIKSSPSTETAFAERGEWSRKVRGLRPVLTGNAAKMLAPVLDGLTPDEAIGRAFTVEVTRQRREAIFGTARIEIALDFGAVTAGRRREAFYELELELLEGRRDDLFSFAQNLCRNAALRLHMQTKSDRGFALLSGNSASVKAKRITLDAAEPVQKAFQRIARGCLLHLIANEAAFWKTKAPEAIHQARVSTRRLRAAMALFRAVLRDDMRGPLNAELRWIAGELGQARDLDVYIADMLDNAPPELMQNMDYLALREEYEERRKRAYENAAAVLASPRFSRALLTLAQWIECGDWISAKPDKPLPLQKFAARRLRRCWKKVRRQVACHTTLRDEARHAWRIDIKKLRYASEFFASLFAAGGPGGDDAGRQVLRCLASLQDSLGALNDLAVAHGRNPLSEVAEALYRKRDAERGGWLHKIDADCLALKNLMPFWKSKPGFPRKA